MDEHQSCDIRKLPRDVLETFAIRAAIRIQQDKREKAASGAFLAILASFMTGALVVVSGFVAGSALN